MFQIIEFFIYVTYAKTVVYNQMYNNIDVIINHKIIITRQSLGKTIYTKYILLSIVCDL